MFTTKTLHLDHVKIDRCLVKTLPPEIAIRYQALPISTDGKKVTVAMAHPEDPIASSAINSALGTPTFLVQVDSNEIEHLIAEVWPPDPPNQLRVLHWHLTNNQAISPDFPRKLADQLHAEVHTSNIPWQGEKSLNKLLHEAEHFQPDLVAFKIPETPMISRLLLDFTLNRLIDMLPTSILVYKIPRWPLRKLLLVIRDGNEITDTAVDWTIRLAKNHQASVTILPLLPPVPEMYGAAIQHSLPALLSANDPLGQKMRLIAHRLSSENVEGNFKLRNNPPMDQLKMELSEGDIDLVAISVEPQNHFWRWLFGEVVNDLFAWLNRPLLITKQLGNSSGVP